MLQSLSALVTQWCPTLCNPMDCSPSGSSVPGILQARILEWAAVSFSRVSSQDRDWNCVSCIEGFLYQLNHQGSPDKLRITSYCWLTVLWQVGTFCIFFCKNLIKLFIIIRISVVWRFMPYIWCSFVLFLRCVSISSLIFILAMAFWNW